jgi:glycosyltransferase involved in cell wall biosynthesis
VGLTPKQKAALPGNILGICRTNDPRELAQLYTAAEVFVNPTYQETFSMVNLEAQACGTPVITYASGGAPETILPGMGRTVPRGDVHALVAAIQEGLPVPASVPVDRLDKSHTYKAYLALYRALTGD